ncbi:MAG: phosphoribosylaminoimidazolesuccinocarboxamide synthase [Candidatus Heimdallarchaeaceae archaeon]
MKYERGKMLNEGKTKRIFELENGLVVLVEYKNAITKYDNPDLTEEFETKARLSNTVNAEVFCLLKEAGLPVAFIKKTSPTEFIARKCRMIGIEAVARRFAVGSYLKRNPSLKVLESAIPKRFHRLVVEFFLKTTHGKLVNSKGQILIDGLDPKKGEEDPFIINPFDDVWKLCHPKKPAWDPEVSLGIVHRLDVLGEIEVQSMMNYTKNAFLILEGAFNTLNLHFIDYKIEFGIAEDGELVIADVIDNDSWRLRSFDWKRLSKEAFRQNEAMSEVEKKYGIVASLVRQWRIPSQVLVLWRGSEKDSFPEIDEALIGVPGLTIEKVTLSGHKSTRQVLDKLNEIVGRYPDGGILLIKVGMSNGLGPILATHSHWPIVNIPATLKSFPQDLWSSVRMPSQAPCVTINRDQNAILFALNVLAMKNPLLYAFRQKQIEMLDY